MTHAECSMLVFSLAATAQMLRLVVHSGTVVGAQWYRGGCV